MLKIDYHRFARAELFHSADFYSKRVPGLGAEFLAEVDKAAQGIAGAPERNPIYLHDVRRFVMPRFPFAIHYRVVDQKIRILSISHTSRYPGHWNQRR